MKRDQSHDLAWKRETPEMGCELNRIHHRKAQWRGGGATSPDTWRDDWSNYPRCSARLGLANGQWRPGHVTVPTLTRHLSIIDHLDWVAADHDYSLRTRSGSDTITKNKEEILHAVSFPETKRRPLAALFARWWYAKPVGWQFIDSSGKYQIRRVPINTFLLDSRIYTRPRYHMAWCNK